MSTLISIIIIPIILSIISLVIEYWIIMPLKEKQELRSDDIQNFGSGYRFLFEKLFVKIPNNSYNLIISKIVSRVGKFLYFIPVILVVGFRTILIIVISIPLFSLLYFTEKQSKCRFNPSCRIYLVNALENFGPYKGFGLALKRIGRCNPFGGYGYDPVPESLENYGPKFIHKHQFTTINIIGTFNSLLSLGSMLLFSAVVMNSSLIEKVKNIYDESIWSMVIISTHLIALGVYLIGYLFNNKLAKIINVSVLLNFIFLLPLLIGIIYISMKI